MKLSIEPYDRRHQQRWDEFVRTSKNGTFLFYRGYMEYHRDRFVDASLLIFDDHGELLSLLPANRDGAHLVSHGGLTYGGFIVGDALKVVAAIEMFDAVLAYASASGIRRLTYKTIPHIYDRRPAGETAFALGVIGGRLVRRHLLSVVSPAAGSRVERRRLRSIKRATGAGLTVTLTDRYPEFWPVLEANLVEVHGVRPVHTLDEILLLHGRFPSHIKLFCTFEGPAIIAGVVIYESDMVAHVQYVGSSSRGRKLGAVDLIYHWLLTDYYRRKPYLDFGNSFGTGLGSLNLGVLEFKESLGGRAVIHDFYELDLGGRFVDPGSADPLRV
jgi:hypothetical protein